MEQELDGFHLKITSILNRLELKYKYVQKIDSHSIHVLLIHTFDAILVFSAHKTVYTSFMVVYVERETLKLSIIRLTIAESAVFSWPKMKQQNILSSYKAVFVYYRYKCCVACNLSKFESRLLSSSFTQLKFPPF